MKGAAKVGESSVAGETIWRGSSVRPTQLRLDQQYSQVGRGAYSSRGPGSLVSGSIAAARENAGPSSEHISGLVWLCNKSGACSACKNSFSEHNRGLVLLLKI